MYDTFLTNVKIMKNMTLLIKTMKPDFTAICNQETSYVIKKLMSKTIEFSSKVL